MHSIIVSCLSEEPLLTAEQVEGSRCQRGETVPSAHASSRFLSLVQVIQEIEEIMQDSSDVEVEQRASCPGVSTTSADVRRAAGGSEQGECDSSSPAVEVFGHISIINHTICAPNFCILQR